MRTLAVLGLVLAIGGLQPLCAEEGADLELPPALRAGSRGASAAGDLDWMAAHQGADGHWSAADFDLGCHGLPIDREPRLPDRGAARHDVTVTGMTLCAYLGAGYTHRGRHRNAGVVARGLRWLEAQQQENGRIGPAVDLRAHAWATLALTEAYGMTGSGLWYEPAKRALARLLAMQQGNGAWPRADGSGADDLLGTFLARMALKSLELIERDAERRGHTSVFGFDPGALRRSRDRFRAWLDARVDARTGLGTASTSPGARPEEPPLVLTAAGLLARIHLGADPRKDAVVRAAAAHLAKHPPTWDDARRESDLAYVWFGTLAMFQVGGSGWKIWNEHLKLSLVDNQHRDGSVCDLRGSWDPRGPWTRSLGRVGSTALATLCLEVCYSYDKVFGDAGDGGVAAPVPSGTWRRSALPPHAARFEDRDGTVLPIESARLAAEIHGVRARVVLDLWVRNPGPRQREGRLRLRLPDGAAPYYLAFGESAWEHAAPFEPAASAATDVRALGSRRSGEWGAVREARMAPTARAREAYRTVVHRRLDPALLTWAGGGVFDLGVFPLVPGRLHRVVLAYEADLVPVGEEYELALDLPDDVPDVAAALAVRGISARTIPEAPVADGVRSWVGPAERAIRVFVRAPATVVLAGPDAAGRDHTAAWVRPDVPEATRTGSPGRAILLLDTSASGRAAHYDIRLKLLEAILAENRDELREFALAAFDSDVRWWRDGFVANTEANVEALLTFARGVELAGATDLGRALAAAASLDARADLFLLSDGSPTWGVAEASVGDPGDGEPGRVFAYRTGVEGESVAVLGRLAESTGGALISLLGADDVRAASRAHRHGVWRLAGLEIPGVTDLFAVGRPDSVHQGQRLRLVGRGRPAPGAGLLLHLERGPHSRTLRVALPAAVPSSMAARAYGHAAVVELEARGDDAHRQALAYASHFRVVREAASLLMLESEQDYETFGLERVDHAARVGAEPVLPVLQDAGRPWRRYAPRPPRTLPGLLGDLARAAPGGVPLPSRLREALGTVPPDRLALYADAARDEGKRPLSRAVGSRLEAEPDSVDALLAAAFDAWDAGQRRRAYAGLCAGAVRHPRSRLLQWELARMAADLGLAAQALVWFEVALSWRGGGDLIDVIAHDHARFLRHLPSSVPSPALHDFALARARSLEPLDLLAEADLVILAIGSAATPDVELCIRGGDGRPRYRAYDTGADGAFFVGTSRDARGPKMFVAPESAPGEHAVEIVLPPGQGGPGDLPVSVQVVVVRDWGRPSERAQLSTVLLSNAAPRTRIDPQPR